MNAYAYIEVNLKDLGGTENRTNNLKLKHKQMKLHKQLSS